MLHDHSHDHDDDGHGHHHGPPPQTPGGRLRFLVRTLLACALLAAAGLAASAVMVSAGQAVVVTEFGNPLRVLTSPGLAWKIPAPVQTTIPVDLRLRSTSTGLQDVGTKDGLRILVQAYVVWQVPAEPDPIRQFLRAVRNDPDEAARQLRSFVGSALQVTASSFDFAELVNTDPTRLRLAAFESRLQTQIAVSLLELFSRQRFLMCLPLTTTFLLCLSCG